MKMRKFADGGETPALDRLASGEDKGSFDTDVYARAKRFLAEQGKAKPAASSAKPSGARSVTNTGDETARLRARYPAPALGAGAGRGGRGGPTAEELQAYQAEKRGAGAGRGSVNRTAKDVAEETGMRARESELANSRGMRSRNAGSGRGFVNPPSDPADKPMTGSYLSPKEHAASIKQDLEFLEGKRPASKMKYYSKEPLAGDVERELRLDSDEGRYAVPGYGDQGQFLKKGGKVKGYAKGGSIDGCAQRGKTKGRYL